jgi:hypothetical protein
LNNAGDTKHEHAAEEEGRAREMRAGGDGAGEGRTAGRRRERERDALGGKMTKITPPNAFSLLGFKTQKEKRKIIIMPRKTGGMAVE